MMRKMMISAAACGLVGILMAGCPSTTDVGVINNRHNQAAHRPSSTYVPYGSSGSYSSYYVDPNFPSYSYGNDYSSYYESYSVADPNFPDYSYGADYSSYSGSYYDGDPNYPYWP